MNRSARSRLARFARFMTVTSCSAVACLSKSATNEFMWHTLKDFTDIKLEKTSDGIAKITINRPKVRNAFRPLTVKELLEAFDIAHEDPKIGVIVLTGEG